MPIYDLTCDRHDPPIHIVDRFLESWRSPNPPCPECSSPTERIWSLGLARDSQAWEAFDTWADLGDGRGEQKVRVQCLADVRRVETLSRRAWEAGFPGARPIAFRIFNQDEGRGGRFENCFGEAPRVAGTFRTKNRDGTPFVQHRDFKFDSLEEMEDFARKVGAREINHGLDIAEE